MSVQTMQVCPMLQHCKDVSKLDCSSRSFRGCSFFKNLMAEYCKLKTFGKCEACKYTCFCDMKTEWQNWKLKQRRTNR